MKFSRNIIGWMFYDFANSAFTTVIVSVVFSAYFINQVAVGAAGYGDKMWGLAVGLSMTLVAITAPILGALADFSKRKKKFLAFFTYLTITFTALLYFVGKGDVFLGMLFFVLANYGFNSANVFYDAFLPEICETKDIGKVSGFGWGLGYAGGLVSLLVSLAMLKAWKLDVRLVFPMISLHLALFSLITFTMLREKRGSVSKASYIKVARERISHTLKHITGMPDLLRYLISYFVYNDGIYTVIVFAAAFGVSQFGMTMNDIILYFILAQFTSLIGAAFFGYLTDKFNVRLSLSISLLIWIAVVIWAFFCHSAKEYYFVGLAAGLAIGSSQANSRTMMSLLTPKDKQAEFFGFFTLTGRLSSILGPILYGWIAALSGSPRWAILSLLVFFVTGWALLQTVSLTRGVALVATRNE